MTEYDLEILAKTIFGEARGEGEQGQIAVACCIFNRQKSNKWFAGRNIAEIIEKAKAKDITNGATHYYNPNVCKKPAWAKDKEPCAKVGHHLFFKGID